MNCNNKFCHWHFDGMCCPESEEDFNNAIPNTLDCQSTLRGDFEEAFDQLADDLTDRVNNLSFSDMVKVRIYLINLEKEKVKV
jgi:hypothetical protein